MEEEPIPTPTFQHSLSSKEQRGESDLGNEIVKPLSGGDQKRKLNAQQILVESQRELHDAIPDGSPQAKASK
jgi:hypothetical protein